MNYPKTTKIFAQRKSYENHSLKDMNEAMKKKYEDFKFFVDFFYPFVGNIFRDKKKASNFNAAP